MIIVFSILAIAVNNTQLAFAGSCPFGAPDSDGDGLCDDVDEFDLDPCDPFPNSPACTDSHVIGGKIIPIDSTSVLVAGVQANYSILTALAVVGVGAGFAFLFFVDKFVCSWRIWAKTLSFSNFRY